MSDENIENNKKEKGRPTKLTGILEEQISRLYELGLTDAQIAYGFSISRATLSTWKKKNPNFLDTIKKAKAIADANVEMSLYKRACGYKQKAVKIFCNKEGETTIVPYIEIIAPDTTACIFWKKNRDPDRWKDRQDVSLSGDLKIKSEISMKDLDEALDKVDKTD